MHLKIGLEFSNLSKVPPLKLSGKCHLNYITSQVSRSDLETRSHIKISKDTSWLNPGHPVREVKTWLLKCYGGNQSTSVWRNDPITAKNSKTLLAKRMNFRVHVRFFDPLTHKRGAAISKTCDKLQIWLRCVEIEGARLSLQGRPRASSAAGRVSPRRRARAWAEHSSHAELHHRPVPEPFNRCSARSKAGRHAASEWFTPRTCLTSKNASHQLMRKLCTKDGMDFLIHLYWIFTRINLSFVPKLSNWTSWFIFHLLIVRCCNKPTITQPSSHCWTVST